MPEEAKTPKKTPEEKEQEYWNGRFMQLEEARNQAAAEAAQEIERIFARAVDELERQISVWYQRFAVNNQVDMETARRMLKNRELEELKWNVQEYIARGREMALNGKWMRELENASARFHISRLQALELDIRNTIETLYGDEHAAATRLVRERYLEGYYHTAYEIQKGIGVGWDIAAIDERALRAVVSKPWTTDGKNFSNRIWENRDKLFQELKKTLARNIMLGRPPGDSVAEFAKKMGVARKNAVTLLYTESAYFDSLSRQDMYDMLGVEQYIYVATLDLRTSEICQELDGQVFEMKDYQIGVNAPPMHPRCRSTTATYYKELQGIGTRAARDPETGKTVRIPKDMNYKQWFETYVKDREGQ